MSRYACMEENVPAPRVGCSCRACYDQRYHALDPRLRELADGRPRFESPSPVTGPARIYIANAVQLYLGGMLDYGRLHIQIIEQLVTQNDALYERLNTMVNLTPKTIIKAD